MFPRRTKPQDPPSTTEAGKIQRASSIQPSKSITLILMCVGPQKIERKILGLRSQKTEIKPSTPEKSINT
jgi:hypothetical protein